MSGMPRPPLRRYGSAPGPNIPPDDQVGGAAVEQIDGATCDLEPRIDADVDMAPRYVPPLDGKDISLIRKLSEVTAAIGTASRTGVNEDRGYAYAQEGDLFNAVRAPLAERSVMLLTAEVGRRRYNLRRIKSGGEVTVTPVLDVLVRFTFMDGDSGEQLSFHVIGPRPDYDGTAGAGAITSAIRSALVKQFLIPLDEGEHVDRAPRPARAGSGPTKLPFGRARGKAISDAGQDDLLWIRGKLDVDDERYGARNRQLLEAIESELDEREKKILATAQTDPER